MNGGVPPGAGRGLRFHLEVGDLDAIDGLVPDRFEAAAAAAAAAAGDALLLHDHNNILIPPNFAARIGLNDTPLTRAMTRGDFETAEALVVEAADPEYLNDGAHSATPLTLALTGRSSYCGQPRNLRLARLLVERGANVNLRIPNHDLETASESPLELLATFYMSLLKSFHGSDRGRETNAGRRSHQEYIETDLLDTIGMGKEEKMMPQTLVTQTRELLNIFLDNGADINLPTTDAGRTIFHVIIAADVLDQELVERMVTLGALVNLTDVHGTTPLMDVIRCKEKDRGADAYRSLSQLGKRLLLDAQNCSGESALFRAMFHGKNSVTSLLLDEGAASFTMARVQENQQRRPPGMFMTYLHRRPSIPNLPSLLAPLLGDSPCIRAAAKNIFPQLLQPKKFNAFVFNEVIRLKIAQFVDLGWFCTREVERTIHELLKAHTQFRHLTEVKVFQEIAIIPMLFGNLSGGLRQRCIRDLFNIVLFGGDSGKVLSLMKKSSTIGTSERKRHRDRHPRSISESHTEWRDVEPGDSACVMPSAFSDSSDPQTSGVNLSEPELSFSTSTPHASRLSLADVRVGSPAADQDGIRPASARQRRFGDNWLLQEDPQYEQHRLTRSSDGIELEISRHEGSGELVAEVHDHHSSRSSLGEAAAVVSRINVMLEETSVMLERLQTEVETVQKIEVDALDRQCGAVVEDIARLSENLEELTKVTDDLHPEEAAAAASVEDSNQLNVVVPPRHDPVIVQLQTVADSLAMSTLSTVSEEEEEDGNANGGGGGGAMAESSFLDSSTSSSLKEEEEEEEEKSADEGSSGEAFSFGHVFYAARSNSQSLSQSTRSSNHEAIIKLLNPEKVGELAKRMGVPPGLMPCLELEAARLQLGLAVYRHKSIECDRGCEGDDSGSSSDTDSSWGPDSLSGPSLTMSESDLESSLDDVDSVLSFEPSVPVRPRILSESSSEDGDDDEEAVAPRPPRRRISRASTSGDDDRDGGGASSSSCCDSNRDPTKHVDEERQVSALPSSLLEEWFSFEGGDAEEETTRRFVAQNLAEGFDLSTDSNTSSDHSDAEETGV